MLLCVRDIVGRKITAGERVLGSITDVVLDDRSLEVTAFTAGELQIPIGQVARIDISSREVQLGPAAAADEAGYDPHLCSVLAELKGLAVHATNGAVGVLDDILFDNGTWQVTHLLVDPHRWLPGRDLVISRDAVGGIDWEAASVELVIPLEVAESASKFDTSVRLGPRRADLARSFVPF